jgi:hypothetical protein
MLEKLIDFLLPSQKKVFVGQYYIANGYWTHIYEDRDCLLPYQIDRFIWEIHHERKGFTDNGRASSQSEAVILADKFVYSNNLDD